MVREMVSEILQLVAAEIIATSCNGTINRNHMREYTHEAEDIHILENA
jgi:hypothetical protein